MAEGFKNWLKVVCESNGAVCVSRTVAHELSQFMKYQHQGRQGQRDFMINWNHNGTNLEITHTSRETLKSVETLMKRLQDRKTFLIVATLEPRKGHAQVLDAFEQLWRDNHEINLVIVGKQGWLVESLVERLRNHTELNKRLFWVEGISDEYLKQVYTACTCLIAASYGEGFGLPLIEAAQHKLPIIARDIPVFREVAGDCAYYFKGNNPECIMEAIKNWLELYSESNFPLSHKMRWTTWNQSAAALLKQVLKKKRI
jgi:glycosyltransferase involved in cell wall biosynthesis